MTRARGTRLRPFFLLPCTLELCLVSIQFGHFLDSFKTTFGQFLDTFWTLALYDVFTSAMEVRLCLALPGQAEKNSWKN